MKRSKVIDARIAKNLTQTQLAEMINVSQNMISQIENGTRTPSAPVMHRLCNVLEINMAAFFESEKVAG